MGVKVQSNGWYNPQPTRGHIPEYYHYHYRFQTFSPLLLKPNIFPSKMCPNKRKI